MDQKSEKIKASIMIQQYQSATMEFPMLDKVRSFFYNNIGIHFDGVFWYNLVVESDEAYDKLLADYDALEKEYLEVKAQLIRLLSEQ